MATDVSRGGEVTRDLGTRYLWIYFCCIFQGLKNKGDWEAESSKMGHYFRNAIFTIATKFAVSGKDGLFCQRNPILNHPFRIEFAPLTDDGRANIMHLCADTDDSFRVHDEDDHKYSPLQTQGWILQEEALSL